LILLRSTINVKELFMNNVQNGDLSKITTYQAGAAQAAMSRVLQKRCDAILKPFGISKMHWLIIGHVLDAGKKGMRVSDLSKTLGTTLSYITTAINLLESKGFLLRKGNDQDGRSKLITINPKKITTCHEIESTLREGLRKSIYAKVDPAEFRIYMKVLYELKDVSSVNNR
jgi:DNA-binding MarR family transcriptional regulator